MKELIDSFLDYLSVERALAKNTIVAYRADLNLYLDFIEKRGVTLLSKSDKNDIVEFMLSQKDQGVSPRSISRRLAAIRMFHRFLARKRVLKSDPTALIDSPKLWKTVPDTLSLNEVEALISQPDPRDKQGARDKAVLETLYATGMRVSELSNLKTNNVNLDIGFLRCIGKGNKEAELPYGDEIEQNLKEWLEIRGVKPGALLCRIRKGDQLDTTQALSDVAIRDILKRTALLAGIDPSSLAPHDMRRSRITHLLDEGHKLRDVQALARHANANTTAKYDRSDREENLRRLMQQE
jgi:integrase/recombinase XerD